jgi:glycosyltransferase involved in cell wall biosynthesis
MRCCIVSYSYYDVDPRVRRYAEALRREGHEVDVCALKRSPRDPAVRTVSGVAVHGLQARSYNEGSPLVYLGRILLFLARCFLFVSVRMVRHPYDVIHVNNVPDFLVFAASLARIGGAKVLLDIHDILPEFYCQKFGVTMTSLAARLLLIVERVSVRSADHVIVANDLWRRKLIERTSLTEDRCTALLNWPDTRTLRPFEASARRGGGGGRPPVVLYPGTLSHLHGVDIAIAAMRLLSAEIPGITLRIYGRAGSESYYRRLLDLVREHSLENSVEFHEPVSTDRLPGIYSEADVGIVPKRPGVFSSEAFSTKIFDFMAAGVPIVASRTAIDEFYFDDSMITFFEPGNEEDLAAAVLRVVRSPDRARSMVEKNLAYVRENSWQRKTELYLGIARPRVAALA